MKHYPNELVLPLWMLLHVPAMGLTFQTLIWRLREGKLKVIFMHWLRVLSHLHLYGYAPTFRFFLVTHLLLDLRKW